MRKLVHQRASPQRINRSVLPQSWPRSKLRSLLHCQVSNLLFPPASTSLNKLPPQAAVHHLYHDAGCWHKYSVTCMFASALVPMHYDSAASCKLLEAALVQESQCSPARGSTCAVAGSLSNAFSSAAFACGACQQKLQCTVVFSRGPMNIETPAEEVAITWPLVIRVGSWSNLCVRPCDVHANAD